MYTQVIMLPVRCQSLLLLFLVFLATTTTTTSFLLPTTRPSSPPPHTRPATTRTKTYLVDPTTATDIISTTTDTLTTTVTTTNNAAEVLKTMGKLMTGPSGFGIVGLSALAIRLYTYFTCQSYIAKLVTLFCDTGTTVELKYGNSLRNLFYYEPNKMEKLIVPTADPKNINTITEVCARLKVAAKANYSVIALPESFEELKLPDESVDQIVSTYMWCKTKNPVTTFAKAMRLLKDGGIFVFVEPVVGDGPAAGIRRYFGRIHRATNAFGDPSLDVKRIVEAWANEIGKYEGIEVEVDVEERGFFFDPHMFGVLTKKKQDRGPDYQETNSEKRKAQRRNKALGLDGGSGGAKGFGSK